MNKFSLASILLIALLIFPLYPDANYHSLAFAAGWSEIPDTKLREVCPPNTPEYTFMTYCPNVVNAWSGAAFDSLRNRLIIWGGGHGDYYGNELYALDLNSFQFQRLTDPSSGFDSGGACVDSLPDGNPVSRHTYNHLAYIEHADRLFAYGGSQACGSGGFGKDTWTFDFQTNQWHNMNPAGQAPGQGMIMTAYDPNTGKVFARNSSHFFAYSFDTNTWETLKTWENIPGYSYMSAVIDPVRKKFVVIGGAGSGTIYVQDIGPGSDYTTQEIQTTGDGSTVDARSPGLAYDPVRDRIIAWNNSDRAPHPDLIYSLNLDTGKWAKTLTTGGPEPFTGNRGTFGRWRYVPKLDAFVAVSSVDKNAFLFYPDEVGSVDPPPDPVDPPPDPVDPPPPSGQIDMPLNTWIAKPIPSDGSAACRGGLCKHMRFAYNTDDKRIYEMGGDHSGTNSGFAQSGRNEIYSYSVADDEWRLEQPYCRADGSPQPTGVDEDGWTYDTKRKLFWMIPGYMWPSAENCPDSNPVRSKIMTYDPVADVWTVPDVTQFPGGTGMKWALYDPVGDLIFTFSNYAVIYEYNISTDTWTKKDFYSQYGNLQFGNTKPVIDALSRKIYIMDSHVGKALYVYDINAESLTVESDDIPATAPTGDQWLHWDSVNYVILYPEFYDTEGGYDFKLHVYNPSTDAWQKDLTFAQPDGITVKGRQSFYDPDQNVLVVLGNAWDTPVPYFFLYRYGNGSGVEVLPAPPKNLRIMGSIN